MMTTRGTTLRWPCGDRGEDKGPSTNEQKKEAARLKGGVDAAGGCHKATGSFYFHGFVD